VVDARDKFARKRYAREYLWQPSSGIEVAAGIGIEQQNLARIFNPFEQVEGSASRKFQGTGLGLALTRRMVELHSGSVWAESGGDRKCSTFRFAIPVRSALKAGHAAA
jgi:signal transduction histidine kinase